MGTGLTLTLPNKPQSALRHVPENRNSHDDDCIGRCLGAFCRWLLPWPRLSLRLGRPLRPPNPSFVHQARTRNIAAQWLTTTLAHGGTLPFSFNYDGKPSSGFLSTWTHQHTIDQTRCPADTRGVYLHRPGDQTDCSLRGHPLRRLILPWNGQSTSSNMARRTRPSSNNIQALGRQP